MEIPQR